MTEMTWMAWSELSLSESLDIKKTIILDLNGHDISHAQASANGEVNLGTNDYLIAVLHGGDLTVKDTEGNSDGEGGTINGDHLCVAIKMTKEQHGSEGDL